MSPVVVGRRGLTGNDAVALAWRQINPDVVAAYPITPSTQVVERFARYLADGEATTEFVPTESEHSALSACVGASAAGARVMTATSSQGLALMHEVLYLASGLRLPIVMAVATRALSAPINIHGDHSDAMGSRDAGWIQLYAGTVQEAYDLSVLAVRVAERARLPVMVCLDGFTLSHSLEPVLVYADDAVRAFVGEARTSGYRLLDGQDAGPLTVGPLALPDAHMDFRRALAHAMARALEVVAEETAAFNAHFGRALPVHLETSGLEEADGALLLLGSTADAVREALVGTSAGRGGIGLVRLLTFRPFPAEAVRKALSYVARVVVMDRADSLSTLGGPLGIEVRAALYGQAFPPAVTDVVYGLGGRELRPRDLERLRTLFQEAVPGPVYVGVEDG